MLTPFERVAYVLLVAVCGALAYRGFGRIVKIVRAGQDTDRSDDLPGRFVSALIRVILQRTLIKARPMVSLFHAFIFFGFSFYLLVNLNDLLEAYTSGWTTLGKGPPANIFNLLSDLFSILVLVGMSFFLVRRFLVRPKVLEFNGNVLLHADVRRGGLKVDSLIVGLFILLHVGSRWMGTAFALAAQGHGDPWLPTASLMASLFGGLTPESLEAARHVCWWLAMGLIAAFIPYFPRSKHLHLMVAPLNLAFERRSAKGLMDPVPDPNAPGASDLIDLPWPQLLDAYACIMCTRCQEVCPTHESGTPLSPAALEINKRYLITAGGNSLLGDHGAAGLRGVVISDDALWSCTTCYACVQICPVGNEPMMDILALRRRMVFGAEMPHELAEVLRCLDEQGNSFGESARKRARWTKELDIEIKDAAKEPVEYLWFVGDFAAFNETSRDASRKLARVLEAAGVDFGILGRAEKSAGNDVRRVGEEGLFEVLAEDNIKTLAECDFKKIITTDPHTYNTLKNEYPAKGGEYLVEHYTTVLLELISSGSIQLRKKVNARVTYHDPCYLGRYNGIYEAPRELLSLCGAELLEMPRNRESSFCCGAGGGRIWMNDHQDMTRRPSEIRIDEAAALGGIDSFVVACPKDLSMFSDAVKTSGHEQTLVVVDLIDLVIEAMDLPKPVGLEVAREA